jgi:hypothetical protein
MYTDDLAIIDKKIDELINDKTIYNFEILKEKIIEILNGVEMFMIENELDSKAIDLYLKKVITKRNELVKQKENSIQQDTKENRYKIIEEICKKCDFQTKEELIQKIEELEKKNIYELDEILKR